MIWVRTEDPVDESKEKGMKSVSEAIPTACNSWAGRAEKTPSDTRKSDTKSSNSPPIHISMHLEVQHEC